MSKAIAGKKAAAFSAAFAIALSAGVVGADATVAQAAEQGQTSEAPAPDEQPNSDGYSVTIHKYKGTESEDQGTGKVQDMTGKTPAQGVKYELQLVKKIEKASDYPEAAKIAESNQEPEVLKTVTPKQDATDANGVMQFEGLEKGLYRVVETSVGDNKDLVIAKPFYVFVPMTDPENNSKVINNVHVYPKNSEVTIDKEVDDMHKNAGQDYTYTINTAVPAVAEGKDLTKYFVEDKLDDKLDATAEGSSVEVKYGDETLTAGATGDYTVVRDGQKISVQFTEGGLKKLKDSNKQVHTKITTKTKEAVKHVPNKATLITNHPRFDKEDTKHSNEVHTYWGNIKVTKKADSEEGELLDGATFQLVRCTSQDGKKWTLDKENSEPLTVDGKKSWTTGEEKGDGDKGTITIKGIHATDFADNSDAEDKKANYCLQETEAPKGYAATDELYHFDLKKADIEKNKDDVEAIEWEKTVVNYSDKNFLPNTGGAGFIAIVMAGLAIIGGGFFAARRNSVKA